MKKLFGILVSLCASVICLTGVSAKEIDLTSSEYDNSYIIGNRVFTLNSYALKASFVKMATDEYRNNFPDETETPMYYVKDQHVYNVDNEGKIDWDNKLNPENYSNVFGVNNDPIVAPEVTPTIEYNEERVTEKVESVITNLKVVSENYGIDNIEYNAESNTITFNISDGEKPISAYAKSGIVDAIKAFISDDFGAKTVEFNGHTYEVKNMTEAEIVNISAAAIRGILDDGAEEKLESLKGKSFTATVTYDDGTEVEYTIAFNE